MQCESLDYSKGVTSQYNKTDIGIILKRVMVLYIINELIIHVFPNINSTIIPITAF